MKLITRALVGAILFAGIGAASAQDQTINDYVRGLVDFMSDVDETLVGDIQVEELEIDQSTEFVFDIDPEKMYFVYGACDDDCYDIDLLAQDADEGLVNADEEDDATPVMGILPGESGDQLHIVVTLVDCETETCVVGVGLYEAAE